MRKSLVTKWVAAAILVRVLAGASTTTAAPRSMKLGPDISSASAFSAFQVWDTDNGATWTRAGIQMTGWYLIRSNPLRLSFISVPNIWGVSHASLAPTGDVVAYASFGVNVAPGNQVTVADTSGHMATVFPGAGRFLWNSDGGLLALLYSHEDTRTDTRGEKKATADSIVIWRRVDQRVRSFALAPMTMEWGSRDTLFLGYSDRVDALNPMTGAVMRTSHRWAAVSPDGQYSLIRDEITAESFRCIEEQTGVEVSGCLLDKLGFGMEPYMAEPFWEVGRDAAHLLCVSGSDAHTSAPKQSNCRGAIFDPRSLEILQLIPGKAVAPSSDGRMLVVLRGDSLTLVPLVGCWL